MLQETASRLRSWFLGLQEYDDGKETGRQVMRSRDKSTHTYRLGAPHSQDCHELMICRWHVRLVMNMKRSLCTGGQASVRRLLAEAKDYSRVEGNVNGYFRAVGGFAER